MGESQIEELNRKYFNGDLNSLVYLDSIAYQIKQAAVLQKGMSSTALEIIAQISLRYIAPLRILKELDKVTEEYFEWFPGEVGEFVRGLEELDSVDFNIHERIKTPLRNYGFKDRASTYLLREKEHRPSGNHGSRSGREPLDEDAFGYRAIAVRALEDDPISQVF